MLHPFRHFVLRPMSASPHPRRVYTVADRMEELVHRWTLLALGALLTGCGQQIAPDEASVAAQGVGPAGRALESAVERVIPSLSNPVVAAALSSELKRLNNALEAGSAGARGALRLEHRRGRGQAGGDQDGVADSAVTTERAEKEEAESANLSAFFRLFRLFRLFRPVTASDARRGAGPPSCTPPGG